MTGLRWYFPWADLDWLLRVELLLWVLAFVLALLVWWVGVVKGRTWLKLSHMRDQQSPSEPEEKG